MPYFRVKKGSSSIDIAPYIEEVKWSENDLDSPDAGRGLDGYMYRGKVTSKRRADVKLIPVAASVLNPILVILRNEYFVLETDIVPNASALTLDVYNSTRSGGIAIVTTDNVVKHKDVSFNIIQR